MMIARPVQALSRTWLVALLLIRQPTPSMIADLGFNPYANGIKARSGGSFGVINLRASHQGDPRVPGQDAATAPSASFLELRFTFVAAGTSTPLTLGRTHITFYDFDEGIPNPTALRECAQFKGTTASRTKAFTTATSELEELEWNSTAGGVQVAGPVQDLLDIVPVGTPMTDYLFDAADAAATPLYCGTVQGKGNDNPTETYDLTELQRSRSVLILFESVSSFLVRYSLVASDGTGRNFVSHTLRRGGSTATPSLPAPFSLASRSAPALTPLASHIDPARLPHGSRSPPARPLHMPPACIDPPR